MTVTVLKLSSSANSFKSLDSCSVKIEHKKQLVDGNAQVLEGSHGLWHDARIVNQVVETIGKERRHFLRGFLDARDVGDIELDESEAGLGVFRGELLEAFGAEIARGGDYEVVLLFQLTITC